MSDRFTLRDFLVYFTTGAMTVVSIDVIFYNKILQEATVFFCKYNFINEFSGLFIVLAVPLIYFIGHLVHGLDFFSLKTYKCIHKKLTDWKWRRFMIIEWIRQVLHFFMYKNRVINSVIQENKRTKTWNTDEDFWIDCAKLQKDGKFGPAEYWYTLNDLLKGLYTTFLFSSIIAFIACKTGLGVTFVVLFLICHFRAIQFADFFVQTVKRLVQ